MKPERCYRVAIFERDQKLCTCFAYGVTFFYARRGAAAKYHVEPGDIRLDPPRRLS